MAKKKKYDWSDPSSPPPLEAHSVAKHNVLEAYLSRYLEVLTKNPRVPEFNIHLIDGFSGGGLYKHETSGELLFGSPTILLQTVRAAEAKINLEREKKLKIRGKYYFVDEDKTALLFLKELIKKGEFADQVPNIEFINSNFASSSNQIISSITKVSKAPRAIFILDQYGYSDVPFRVIQNIFSSIPHAEIIITFATDWLIDYLSNNEQSKSMIADLGLSGLDLRNLEDDKAQDGWRTIIEHKLSISLHNSSGAKFFTPFFIKTVKSNRSYWLIHLSNHARARDEMMQVHWSLTNQFIHHGGAGLSMLGYVPKHDAAFTGVPTLFEFSEIDKDRSIMALSKDIPNFIHECGGSITFGELTDRTANTSPASLDMYKEALMNLTRYEGFQIITPKGHNRISSSQVSSDDTIQKNPQQDFHFMKKR